MLKSELAFFKALPFISYLELNRKEAKTKFAGQQMFMSSAVTFDFMAIFNIQGGVHRNEKGHTRFDRSFSFCFNFKDAKPTIRAATKPHKDSSAEYSREFSVSEIKEKMQSLMALDIQDKEDFLKSFVEIFEIVLSTTLSEGEIKAIKSARMKEFEVVLAAFKKTNQTVDAIRENMRNNTSDEAVFKSREQMRILVAQAQDLIKQRTFLLNDGAKDIPAYPRELVYTELRQRNIIS